MESHQVEVQGAAAAAAATMKRVRNMCSCA